MSVVDGRWDGDNSCMIGWCSPPARVVKINTDVVVSSSGTCVLGMVARDSRGVVLASAAASEFHSLSVVVAEGLDVWLAIRLTIKMGFKDVIFKMDNLTVVSA